MKQGTKVGKISKLDDVVKLSKKLNIPLMIELKPTGDESENYIKLFLKKYREIKVPKNCKVISLDIDVLESIEHEMPEINTGYLIPFQFGDFQKEKWKFAGKVGYFEKTKYFFFG